MLLRQRTPYRRPGRADWLRTCKKVGEILKKNGFPKNILLVADRNTLAAAKGIEESLKDFSVEYKIYDEIRVARMEHVEELESIICGRAVRIICL